jgi:hypothetical protein
MITGEGTDKMKSPLIAVMGVALVGFFGAWAQGSATGSVSTSTTTTTVGGTSAEVAASAAGSAGGGVGFEGSLGSVTVGNEQWTRMAFGVEAPIWRFGVFFDIELYLDQNGNPTNLGWDFKNEPLEAITRKIRYIRYGQEQDPLFIKVGGLSDVTLGYGFIVDRFTNMLHYPDQKPLGVQLNLNRLTALDASFQFMLADADELRSYYDGGIGAARFALRPLKQMGIPFFGGLQVGATYALDRNVYASARDWQPTANESLIQSFQDSGLLTNPKVVNVLNDNGYNVESTVAQIDSENAARSRVRSFGIYGFDLCQPIIGGPPLSLDLYGQTGMRNDSVLGWGFGAPGVAIKVWRLNAALEYRHTEGRFEPGFFGPYYMDERLVRYPTIYTKADSLPSGERNGAFGRMGLDAGSFMSVSGAYQYMAGRGDSSKDQRFEATAALGSIIVNRIPRLKRLEAYIYKINIGSDITRYDTAGAPILNAAGRPTYDRFFERTSDMYYGYRFGFAITQGATLIWDSRFGFTRDSRGNLTPNNNIIVQTAFTF